MKPNAEVEDAGADLDEQIVAPCRMSEARSLSANEAQRAKVQIQADAASQSSCMLHDG